MQNSNHRIEDEAALVALLGGPSPVVAAKKASRLHEVMHVFITSSPFVCIATADEHGRCDVSPRGDPPGFVRILDDQTLLLPERPGNKLADSLKNILKNPHVGVIFFLPGRGETFRVNGRAHLTTDPALLAGSVVEGRTPLLGIVIAVEEAYTQCPKALLRSHLWDPLRHIDVDLPSGGTILRCLKGEDFDAEAYDAERAARYARREGFY